MDTNAGQFERLGNPWIGDAKPRTAKQAKRAARRKAGISSAPRVVARGSREAVEAFHDIKAQNAIRRMMQQRNGSRTVVQIAKPAEPPIALEIRPAAKVELNPFDPAKLAADAERHARWLATEKRQVTECKLAQLGDALAKYEKKARKIFA